MNIKKSSCKEVLDRLPLYVGGELDSVDAELVLAHLGHCARCAGEEQMLERAQVAFRASLQAPVNEIADPDLWSGIRASLVAEDLIRDGSTREVLPAGKRKSLRVLENERSRPRFQLVRRLGGLAAAAALVTIASLVGFDLTGSADSGERSNGLESIDSPVANIPGGPGSLAAGPTSFDLPTRGEAGEQKMQPIGPGETSLTQDAVLFVPRLSQRTLGIGASPATGSTSLVGNTGRVEVELR